jgi:DNA-directed RNA polymerase specialized sigma24 family protein
MQTWAAIRSALERELRAASASEPWARARQLPFLGPFERPEHALAFVMAVEEDRAAKNDVFAALVLLAQSGTRLGVVVLTLALWPSLSIVRRRWRSAYRGREADLAADVASTFVMRVHKLDVSGGAIRVAATLCRNTDHELCNAYRRTNREPLLRADPVDFGHGSEEPAQRLELQDWIAQEAGPDAELCIRVILDGEAAIDVARDLDVPATAAWQRLHRASGRLRRALRRETESPSGCQVQPSPTTVLVGRRPQ